MATSLKDLLNHPLSSYSAVVDETDLAAHLTVASTGLTGGGFYNFAPVLLSLADTTITPDQNLVLNFSETVTAVSGSIRVCDSSGEEEIRKISVTDKAVSVSGNVVTVDLPTDLAVGSYCVKVDVGAFEDVDHRDFISSTSVISFSVSEGGTGGDTGGDTGTSTDLALDGKGTDTDPVSLDALTGSINYTDNAADAVGNNVTIKNFSADDQITITGAVQADYDDGVIGVNDAGDVTMTYNNDGVLNQITLTGVAPAGSLIFDVASFNALTVGNLIFA